MAKPTMVSISFSASLQTPMDPEPSREPPSTPRTSGSPPFVEKTEIDGMSCLRNSFTNYNISGHVADILMASWRSGTQKQYKTYIEQWLKFYGERKINCYSPQIGEALDFLAGLYDKHLSYSTLNTASISSLVNFTHGYPQQLWFTPTYSTIHERGFLKKEQLIIDKTKYGMFHWS